MEHKKEQLQREVDSSEKQYPWYMSPPPKWIQFLGKWGWLFSIPISIASVIIAVAAMK